MERRGEFEIASTLRARPAAVWARAMSAERLLIAAVFRHRHRQLQRHFGGAPLSQR